MTETPRDVFNDPWMITRSGRWVRLDKPEVESIDVDDIAIALSRIHRFTGHTDYSVAAHSLYVADLVHERHHDPALYLGALLHDAHEAYIGDIATPVKVLIGRERVRDAALVLDLAIGTKFGIGPMKMRDSRVKQADLDALHAEAYWLLPDHGWYEEPPPVDAHQPYTWLDPDTTATMLAAAIRVTVNRIQAAA